MDKKTKKKIEVLRKKQESLRQQLAGAKLQPDEPDEVQKIEAEIQSVQEQIENLKSN